MFAGVWGHQMLRVGQSWTTRAQNACAPTWFLHPHVTWFSKFVQNRNKMWFLPSLLMPTAMHFFNLQYWQRLRLMRRMEHCWFLVHGLYCIFCWMDLLKKPCEHSSPSSESHRHVIAGSSSLSQPESLDRPSGCDAPSYKGFDSSIWTRTLWVFFKMSDFLVSGSPCGGDSSSLL